MSLRRARITAQHVRDTSFEEYRALGEPQLTPANVGLIALNATGPGRQKSRGRARGFGVSRDDRNQT